MGEVDQLEYAIHHGVAKCDQGINAAHGKAVGELLQEFFHAVAGIQREREGMCRTVQDTRGAAAPSSDGGSRPFNYSFCITKLPSASTL